MRNFRKMLRGGYRAVSRTECRPKRCFTALTVKQQESTNEPTQSKDGQDRPKRKNRRKLLFGNSSMKSLKDFLPLPASEVTSIVRMLVKER